MEKTELLACPFCGEVPRHGYGRGATWHKISLDNCVYISCSSDAHDGMCLQVRGDTFEDAAKCWNRRTQSPENKPLTVEELREMDGEPVWLEPTKEWRMVCVYSENGAVRIYTVFNTISAESVLR